MPDLALLELGEVLLQVVLRASELGLLPSTWPELDVSVLHA
jgi:hypothetical protein